MLTTGTNNKKEHANIVDNGQEHYNYWDNCETKICEHSR